MVSLETKIRRAEEKLEREQEQSSQVKLQTAISVGTTLTQIVTRDYGVGGRRLADHQISAG